MIWFADYGSSPQHDKKIRTSDINLAMNGDDNDDNLKPNDNFIQNLNTTFNDIALESPNDIHRVLSKSTSSTFSTSMNTITGMATSLYRPAHSQSNDMINDVYVYEILNDDVPFTPGEILELYNLKSNPAIVNYEALHDNIMELNHIIEEYFYSKYYTTNQKIQFIQQYQIDHANDFQDMCCLSYDKRSSIQKMLSCETKTDSLIILDQLFEQYNIELTKMWSEFLSSIRKAMPVIKDLLQYEHNIKSRMYWKRQSIVQTCR